MLSTKYNQAPSATINDANRAPFKSKIQKLTRAKSAQAEMSPAGTKSSQPELDQWHKLMGDYERLQLVASSKAHNKLIRSSSESSLGSSSNLSQASTVVASSNSSPPLANSARPTSMIARLSPGTTASVANKNNNSEREMRENYAQESEIGQCLSELVESVVAATQATSEQAKVTYEHEEQPRPFRSFKLHEAILAKTLSSSSDNASSGDDEATAETKTSDKRSRHKQNTQVTPLGQFALTRQEALDREHVIYAAREFACSQRQTENNLLTVASLFDLSQLNSIKWLDVNNNEDQLEMSHVTNCQLDDELIVWLIGPEVDATHTACDEIDLDDIAMALNEPIAVKSSQQIKALVWSCASLQDAQQFKDLWARYKQTQEQHQQIEVKPCEVAANSPAAEQMKSSGLFVLQQPRPPVDVECSRERAKQQPEVVKAKSASTLDLTTSSSLQQPHQVNKPTEGANLLANYYRSVTDRMMGSNGATASGRLKNFTQEVSKLNGRGQTSLVKSARRLSMALNQFSQSATSGAAQQQRQQQTEIKQSTIARAVPSEPAAPPAVKPRTSVLKSSSLAPECAPVPRSILKKQCTTSSGSGSGSDERIAPGEEKIKADKLERIKQRASCHDLVRLVADSETDNKRQLAKLSMQRAGSTSSVASRSRQRRPALLLNDADDEAHLKSTTKTEQMDAAAAASSFLEPKSAPSLTASSVEAADGMARAKVSMSHLRRSASMKVLAAAAAAAAVDSAKVGERQLQVVDDNLQERTLPVSNRKKSEFDPRSLRKLTNSEAAQALREGAAYNASYEERKLRREKARRRRSMANLCELKCELDADAQQVPVAAAPVVVVVAPREEPKVSVPSSFSKSFTLLRQSFRQKNLSSMLGLSNGTRGASAPAKRDENANEEEQPQHKPKVESASKQTEEAQIRQQLEAIKMAEANLLAAKQLKQQAQRLREQQKRNEQQLQIHKQQQLIYQQQQQQQQQHYVRNANRSHTQQQQLMFDPTTHFHQQQQQQQQFYQAQQFQMYQQRQQQQQQQMAYLSSSSSQSAAHFMAAAAAAAASAQPVTHVPQLAGSTNHFGAYAPSAMVPAAVPFIPNHQLPLSAPAQPINHQRAPANRYLYSHQQPSTYLGAGLDMQAQQQQQQQQFIPMSVNHHSSFNIVYTAATSGANNLQHYQPHYVTQPYLAAQAPLPLPHPQPNTINPMHTISAQMHQPRPHFSLESAVVELQQPAASRLKHSSLGASVRKTMRSVLNVGGGSGKSSKAHAAEAQPAATTTHEIKPSKPLKSALKSSSSDASDDASPASSSTSSSSSSTSPLSSSSASDSSLASSGSTQNHNDARPTKSATLTKRELERLRKEFIMSSGNKSSSSSSSASPPTPSELAVAAAAAQTRKNVTFSTKLTSIL